MCLYCCLSVWLNSEDVYLNSINKSKCEKQEKQGNRKYSKNNN